MLTIKIEVNKEQVKEFNVRNVSEEYGLEYGKEMQLYEVEETKQRLLHHFDDGAEILAFKALHHITFAERVEIKRKEEEEKQSLEKEDGDN